MSVPPAAYKRALGGRRSILTSFEESCARLKAAGRKGALQSFLAILSRGKASINMPILKAIRFIEDGSYLSIYEFVAQDTGFSGRDLEREVSKRLREFGPLRLKLDQFFQFQNDTHYASLNLGGGGALRYGLCCVVFDLQHWAPFFTCFGGDSIRSCFDSDKKLVLMEEQILARFAIGEDLHRLAVIQWEQFFEEQDYCCVCPSDMRGVLETEDSLLEVHLHGPVARNHIHEVRFRKRDYLHLRAMERRAQKHSLPLPWEYDNVGPFQKILELLDRFEIPLVLAED